MASIAIVQSRDNRTGSLLVVAVAVAEVVCVGQSQKEAAAGPVDKLVVVVDDSQQEVEADSDVLRANLNVSVIVEAAAAAEQEWWVDDMIEMLYADVQVERSSADD